MPIADYQMEPFYVPTIDITPFLENPDSPGCDKLISEVRRACLSTGFFQITGHGIAKKLQQSVFDSATELFALPFKEKKKLDAKKTVGHRGYDVLASQSYEANVLPDFEGNPAEAYHAALLKLAIAVLDLIARTLPFGANVFDQRVSNDPVGPLRLLHYPKARKTKKRQLGASAHVDFGAITLLLRDPNPGLEVLDQQKGEWVSVEPNTDAYVVNISGILSTLTSNKYKSSWHRVLNANPCDRYSIIFFFEGKLNYPLAPLDGTPVEGMPLTVEQHMIKKMTESYGKGEKGDGPAKTKGTDGVTEGIA